MSELIDAKPFNPDKPYSEVQAHKEYRFKQNGIYYDHLGNPVAEEPPTPSPTAGVRRLNASQSTGNMAAAQLNLSNDIQVGSVPDTIAQARRENAQAAAAEDLLA